MEAPFVQESVFDPAVRLDRSTRSAYSGSGVVVLSDEVVHVPGMTAERLFPAGTATALIHPWALRGGSETFSVEKNCLLEVLALSGRRAIATLRYLTI